MNIEVLLLTKDLRNYRANEHRRKMNEKEFSARGLSQLKLR